MLYYVPDLDRKATNLAFFRDLQLHRVLIKRSTRGTQLWIHTFGTCIFFYAPNRMLYSAVDFNLTAVIVKVVNDITDSNENQTIILKTWFQDYLPLKTWTFPCKYMIGVLCYGSSLIKTLRWLAGLSGLQVTQDWKRKEKRIEIFNKM